MVTTVYRKIIYADVDNSHSIEKWKFVKDQVFEDRKNAIDYAKHKNRRESEAVNIWHGSMQALDDFLHVFTLDRAKYLTQRKYFVDEVPVEDVQNALSGKGVKIINDEDE